MLPELESRVERGELSLRGVNPRVVEVDEALLVNVNTPTDLVVAMAGALDLVAVDDRPVALPDESALQELSTDFWSTALWAGRRLRKGEVFVAVDAVNGSLKRSLVTLMSWHARAVDAEAEVWDGGRLLERWADAGALASFERAYAHYDLRDVARALWETIDLFQGLEEETARRLGLEVTLDHAELTATPGRGRPRPETRGYSLAVKRAGFLLVVAIGLLASACGDDSPTETTTTAADTMAARVYFIRDGKVWPVYREIGTHGLAEPLALRAAGTRPDRGRARTRLQLRGACRRH